ncbi:sulfotransferase domain-containing protein [uncultured Draconibacterium sp.]|uniref:sulfotransferase domain-containing protein n=1 Tax=uncultured Draconibacterium sp. TaxID=1573823 RepID=UPI002AA6AE2F|nr:sulfotransferase domain-containing protein [uncultured Draconibacterium sp.]
MTLTKFIHFIRYLIFSFILKFKNFNHDKSILIFSEARGGSTWLMELLKVIPRTCINWEPLHLKRGVVPASYRFGSRPYLPDNEKNTDYLALFEEIHTLKRANTWTTKLLTYRTLTESNLVITKYVRANLLVPFLLNNFSYKYSPIFLLRHPVDTCISQIKAFDNGDFSIQPFGIPDCINNERFYEHYDYIKSLRSKLEQKIAIWCLNNCPTINRIHELDVQIIFYSDLVLNPKLELQKILDSYDINVDSKSLKNLNFTKASRTDFNNELKNLPEEQLYKNFKKLDEETKEKIQNVFDHFEFRLYCAFSPFPAKEKLLA